MNMMRVSLLLIVFAVCIACVTAVDKPQDQCDLRRTKSKAEALFLNVDCALCEVGIETTRTFIRTNESEHAIEEIVDFFCKALHIEDPIVCYDIVVEFQDFFFYLILQDVLSPHVACGILGACEKPNYPTWNVTFPKPQPPIKPYPSVDPKSPRMYFLHISDVHLDPLYTPGLSNNCGEPICCRPPNSPGKGTEAAGKWGDYNCDIPQWVYENMLEYISKNIPEISFAIFTGDIPPHDVWLETRESALKVEAQEFDIFRRMLPNVPLYNAMGNHESVPVNEFATRDIKGQWDMEWLYTPMAKLWGQWLDQDAVKQAAYAGYYTTLIRGGLRLIALNTNLGCNNQNWWLTLPSIENADPDQQLHWLVDTLQAAEDANEMVYIASHIEAGGNCEQHWWNNYFKIIQRYRNILIASFAGHTHNDLTHTTYEQATANTYSPLLTTYLPGSVTTFFQLNPGFRIYEMDSVTKALVDYRQYVYNLTQANIDGFPTWYLEYSPVKDYQMKDLSPQSWHDAAMRMSLNQTMLYQYAVNRNHGYEPGPCDAGCLFDAWCDMWASPPHVTQRICGY